MDKHWMTRTVLVIATVACVAATAAEPRATAPGLLLPGTFTGDLPTASGGGLRHQLDLWPDQVYQLRRTWLGRDDTRDQIGRWHVDPARRALVLAGDEQPAPQFEILGNGELRLLDQQGQPIESALPYELTRADEFTPFEPQLKVQGAFVYYADAARFTECASGRAWPVAMEADYVALERAYLAARAAPLAPVQVEIEARFADRPRREGDGLERNVIVERFIAVMPSEACERTAIAPTLRNTYWRVRRLGDHDLDAAAGRREPYLLLLADQPRYAATVGCNQMLGGADVEGATLRLRPGPTILMACPPPLDEQERRFADVLGAVAAWSINGRILELSDRDGDPVAIFEAAYGP